MSTNTKIDWAHVVGAAGYVVRWRRTDASNWEHESRQNSRPAPEELKAALAAGQLHTEVTYQSMRVDDWVFGVSSVSKDGFESPVASAVPGGAFKPYVVPSPKQP